MTGIKKAVDLAGGANALAHKLGVTHQAIYVWMRKGWVPAQRALEIEHLFDIPRVELFKPELAALLTSKLNAVDNVQPITPHNTATLAPAELRELQGWLMWRFEQDPNDTTGKPLKVPYYADGGKRHGKQGGIDDRGRMTTFAAARDAAAKRGFTGVGLALMPEFGITALDFDNCVNAQGELPQEIEEITSRTYAEYSPSGKGIRAFVRGSYGNRKSPTVGNDYGFETFTSTGFVTFTGNIMPYTDLFGLEDTIAHLDALVAPLCAARFVASQQQAIDPDDFMIGHEPKIGLSLAQMDELLYVLDADMQREDWIKVGMALHHECDGDDTGFYLWDDWSQNGSKYPSEESLRTQWDSFERRKGSGHRQVTMASVLKMAKEAGASISRPTLAATVDDLRVQP
jgi:DNA-binding transcriptional regulator YdaS (Cro superfamily)